MKLLGLLICVGGSMAAVAYPPYRLLVGDVHWGFVLDDIAAAFGQHIRVLDHVDVQTLLMELLVINLIGVALILVARR